MNLTYDKHLLEIPFYQLHPEYLPFVGDAYAQYRVLLVGESHYLDQEPSSQTYDLAYFTEHWWNGDNADLSGELYAKNFHTRGVIERYLNGNRTKGHLLFTNLGKVFSETVLEQPIDHIDMESSQVFQCFAFMNFFQMPSLFSGGKYWNSLKCSEMLNGAPGDALACWDRCVAESAAVLDDVIRILQPELIVFSSASAYDAYTQSRSARETNCRLKKIPHAGCSWWNRKTEAYGNRTGREIFREILEEYLAARKRLEKHTEIPWGS